VGERMNYQMKDFFVLLGVVAWVAAWPALITLLVWGVNLGDHGHHILAAPIISGSVLGMVLLFGGMLAAIDV